MSSSEAPGDLPLPNGAPEGLRIYRRSDGVLGIRGRDLRSLFWGMGFCHATDRSLQLLITRVLGQGRAGELLESSEEMLGVDRFFRRMGWANGLEAELEKLDDEVRLANESYCSGINAGLRGRAPWELRLLGFSPEPWSLGDGLLLMRLIGWVGLAQSQGEVEDLFLEMVQAGVPEPLIDGLFPGALDDVDVELLRQVRREERLVPEEINWLSGLPRMMASNNWVVSPERSKTGAALLANDPHLEINRIPAVWQELVLELPQRTIIGATMPGIPAVILGRSDELSWGVTYSFMDAVDSWIEDCQDGSYLRGTEWKPFRERRETILRKKKPPVHETFWENDHGVLDGNPWEPGKYLARRWAAGEGGALSLVASYKLMSATTVERGMFLLGQIETSWNWVLADQEGNIGYQMSGLMPSRRAGLSGLVPVPGWMPENDWLGFVPAEDLPRSYNPDEGFLVTANNDLNHLGEASPINAPMGSERARRIEQLLLERSPLDLEDFQAIQYDVYSLHAEEFLSAFGPLLPEGGTARAELLAWDFRYDVDSMGAGLFEDFYAEVRQAIFGGDGLGGEVFAHLVSQTGIFNDFYERFDRILLDWSSAWWEGKNPGEVAAHALDVAGDRPRVRWGDRNKMQVPHLLFGGKLPSFLGFDAPEVELPGGRATPHQGQLFQSDGRQTSFAPSVRIMADMGEAVLYTNLPGGPSDRRFSGHYASGWKRWRAGTYKRLGRSDE